jgi:hypothetical protein
MATAEELKNLANREISAPRERNLNLASPQRSTPSAAPSSSTLKSLARTVEESTSIDAVAEQAKEGFEQRPEYRSAPAFQDPLSFGEYLSALGSIGSTLAVAAATQIQASGEALGVGAYEYVMGNEDPILAAIQAGEQVQEQGFGVGDLTIPPVPQNETARDVFGLLAKPIGELDQLANRTGESVRDATGSTALGSATATAIAFSPDLLGLRGITSRVQNRIQGVRAAREARSTGVSPGASRQTQAEQIIARGESLTGDAQRSEAMTEISESVVAARKAAENAEAAAWQRLRETDAYVNINDLAPLRDQVTSVFREREFDIDLPQFEQVRRRLDELDELTLPSQAETVDLSRLVRFRKRLNSNRPTDATAALANDLIKAQLDRHLLNDFSITAIKGDANAQAAWKDALDKSTYLRDKFNSKEGIYRVLNLLSTKEATPEQMRQYVFGANAIQGNKMAGGYIKALKEVLGENSPEINALRKDALLDVLDPLIRENPNVSEFVNKYDTLLKKSPTLTKELFSDSSKEIRKLGEAARAAVRAGKEDLSTLNLSRAGAQILFGHEIAKSALQVSLAERAFSAIRNIGAKGKKRRFLEEMLGFDYSQPIIPKSRLALIEGTRFSLSETAEEDREQQEQEEQ